MEKTTFVSQLSLELQAKLYDTLRYEFNLENEDLEFAMDSRVCDLEELLTFKEIQQLEKGTK